MKYRKRPSTYLGLVEDPVVVGIISEGFLNASCGTGNVVAGYWPDLDGHNVAEVLDSNMRIQNARMAFLGARLGGVRT
jgi:hypothetical protein